MQLSEKTIRLLADEMECPQANKVYDSFIDNAMEVFVKNPKENKTYFSFHAINGTLFLTQTTK